MMDLPFIAKVEKGIIITKLFYFMDKCKGYVEQQRVKNVYQKLANNLREINQNNKGYD